MSMNYKVIHYIQSQMADFDPSLTKAVVRLFNIEEQAGQCGGCVIDSVAMLILLKKHGITAEIHLGEICSDGEQDAYHFWLTVDDKIVDIGIYGNSNFNPYYKGKVFETPIIFENKQDVSGVVYYDGSTEISNTWLANLSELSVLKYIKMCPKNRLCKLICKALDIAETQAHYEEIYNLADGLFFPKLEKLEESPSGRRGI